MRSIGATAWRAVLCVALLSAALGQHGLCAAVLATEPIPDFSLRDFRGTTHRLSELDEQLVVVVFVGTECPLVRLYAPRLVELYEEFAPRGVAFWAIDSNRQDSLPEIEHFARTYHLRFPLLRDPGNRVADLFGAQRTPEAFVLDARRVVRYRGRIDDQYGFRDDGRSFQRNAPQRRDLAEALNALLSGRTVDVPETRAFGCLIGRVRDPDANSPVTWSEHIAPIFQRRCQACHRQGQIAPFPLMSYDDVRGWEAMIREVIELGRMPPWHADAPRGQFANDARLTDEEKLQIFTWIEHGAPEGDPSKAPPPAKFTDGWQIPEPDVVFHMSPTPFDVPAEGVVEYQYFVVDPGFREDRWVRAAEARPGNRAVVHHVNVFVLLPEMGLDLSRQELADRWELQSQMLCGFVPGTRPVVFPPDTAKLIPAGARLVFQLHYTPNGTPQQDRSYVGLCFTDASQVRHRVQTVPAMNCWFEIPPHAADYQVDLWHTLHEDVLVLSFLPHMHLRGKSFRYEAHYPDGRQEVLLNVPRYDFNWQNTYVLARPKRLPAGTRVRCVATFDNSADNLSNPDPSASVRWGDQTWDEMMIGYFDIVPAERPATASAGANDRMRRALVFAGVVLGAVVLLFGGRRWLPVRRSVSEPSSLATRS